MMFIKILLLTISCAIASSATVDDEWKDFKVKFKKTYKTTKDETKKFEIFKENLNFIHKHNENEKMTFKLAVNRNADLSDSDLLEAKGKLSEFWYDMRIKFTEKIIFPQEPSFNKTIELPDAIDWRDRGAVMEVKDQAKCGSCYAFASIGTLESHHFIKTGKFLNLSEQEIVDCSSLNSGCDGGSVDITYNYIIDNGISLSSDYSYKAKQEDCRNKDVSRSEVKVFGFVELDGEENFTKTLAQFGPISVSINALPKTFRFYKEGIFSDPMCNESLTNHGVIVIGYGRDKELGRNYWIIKNSWSKGWGENGYMRLERNNKTFGTKASYFPLMDESVMKDNSVVYYRERTIKNWSVNLIVFGGFFVFCLCCCCLCRKFCCKKKICCC